MSFTENFGGDAINDVKQLAEELLEKKKAGGKLKIAFKNDLEIQKVCLI